MCKTCVDQGNCAEGTFFNPNTCRCTCLPECCDDGYTWSYESCTCEPDNYVCSEADGVYEWFQSIDAEWEASVNTMLGPGAFDVVKTLSVEDIVGLGLTCLSLPASKDPANGSSQQQDEKNPCKCFNPNQCPDCNLTPTIGPTPDASPSSQVACISLAATCGSQVLPMEIGTNEIPNSR
jgi:hypothetical protein